MTSEKIPKIIPIILAGGTGSRLWPLSRKSYPKQFINLINDDEYTLLQKTYKRIESIENICKPIVICNEEHRFIVAHQMKDIDADLSEIVLEPEGKNTTPAITIAALKVLEKFSNTNIDPVLLILSSDHVINHIGNFQLTIKQSINHAKEGNLVIFGVAPNYPSTGYGYIKSQDEMNHNNHLVSRVDHFVEKPDAKTAKLLIKDKKYVRQSLQEAMKGNINPHLKSKYHRHGLSGKKKHYRRVKEHEKEGQDMNKVIGRASRSLNIKDDGQVEMTAKYRGRIETTIGTNQVNVFQKQRSIFFRSLYCNQRAG